MNAESILRSIPGFSRARITGMLSDGPSNASYRIERSGDVLVLRLDKPANNMPGLDRRAEQAICELTFSAGLSPEPVCFDHDKGVYIRHFVPGSTWGAAQMHDINALNRLAALLRQLHGLPTNGKKFDPTSAVQSYAEQVGTDQVIELQSRALDLLSGFSAQQEGECLCHNDLVSGNILEADRLMLIDWEYAGVGDPWFDLAVVVQHHGLGNETARVFLETYLQRKAGDREMEHLHLACAFYQCLFELWKARTERL